MSAKKITEAEMEEDDTYASIFEVCSKLRRSRGEVCPIHDANNPPQTPTVHEGRFIDQFSDVYGAIIPPESIGEYLCRTPETTSQHHDHDNNNYHHNINPPCVESFQIPSPPPVESPLWSPDHLEIASVDHLHEGHRLDCVDNVIEDDTMAVNDGRTEAHPGEGAGLWLSQLKSMARDEGFFDHVVSLVTRFRASQYRLSLCPSPPRKELLGSSSKSRQKVRSLVSSKPPVKRRKLELVDLIEVVRSKSSRKKRDLGPQSKSKSKGKNVSAASPLKQPKYSVNNLGLERSNSKTCNELIETEGASVIVMSDSPEEECRGRVIGLGGDKVKERMSLTDSEVGGSRADPTASLWGTKNSGDLDKSKGIHSSAGAAGQRERASSISKAATSGSVVSGLGQNLLVKRVFDTLKVLMNGQPGGSASKASGPPNDSAVEGVPLKEFQLGVSKADEVDFLTMVSHAVKLIANGNADDIFLRESAKHHDANLPSPR